MTLLRSFSYAGAGARNQGLLPAIAHPGVRVELRHPFCLNDAIKKVFQRRRLQVRDFIEAGQAGGKGITSESGGETYRA